MNEAEAAEDVTTFYWDEENKCWIYWDETYQCYVGYVDDTEAEGGQDAGGTGDTVEESAGGAGEAETDRKISPLSTPVEVPLPSASAPTISTATRSNFGENFGSPSGAMGETLDIDELLAARERSSGAPALPALGPIATAPDSRTGEKLGREATAAQKVADSLDAAAGTNSSAFGFHSDEDLLARMKISGKSGPRIVDAEDDEEVFDLRSSPPSPSPSRSPSPGAGVGGATGEHAGMKGLSKSLVDESAGSAQDKGAQRRASDRALQDELVEEAKKSRGSRASVRRLTRKMTTHGQTEQQQIKMLAEARERAGVNVVNEEDIAVRQAKEKARALALEKVRESRQLSESELPYIRGVRSDESLNAGEVGGENGDPEKDSGKIGGKGVEAGDAGADGNGKEFGLEEGKMGGKNAGAKDVGKEDPKGATPQRRGGRSNTRFATAHFKDVRTGADLMAVMGSKGLSVRK